ncbi:nucleoside phosphorylase domain-containing protein [Aspergillus keveii]|uniref:Nucleoside phosphorylase domain-containing protein n=1 Tax=Aspergillus keveii TaxID=714993 RepID=A0ABR4G0N1_9EURO
MRLSFPSIQVGLMVGIGGGVPSTQSDIRLGDVVVGRPTRDSGGVIQYDFGKTVRDGQFKHQGSLNKPLYAVLTAMSRLQAQHQLQQNASHDYFQGSRQVILKPASILSTLVKTKTDSNQVMKHGATRDRLAQQYGFLCFEMEAAGLVDHFPCAVIRGICDYADSHKNKEWQPYAAMTAAAYTKELLGVMPSMGTPETARTAKAILRNLSQYDHERVHRRLSHKRVANTTQWFIDHPDFQNWLLERSIRSLWCTGKIGSGKTIIATSAVDVIKGNAVSRQVPTIFFYCEPDNPRTLEGTFVLISLINQLYPFLSRGTAGDEFVNVQKAIVTFFGTDRTQPDFWDLRDIMMDMNSLIPDATYILDGLDSLN